VLAGRRWRPVKLASPELVNASIDLRKTNWGSIRLALR